MSLFFIGYTATQIPTGIMGDKIGRKNITPLFLFLWLLQD